TFSIRNRLEYLFVNQPERTAESGWMMYQDFIWKPTWPARYELKFRYALFDTDGYDSRIYTYEHDVLYAFSVPAYYNRGSRAYLIGKYDLSRWSELTVRLSQTFYADRNQIGSGLNEIDGSTRTEVKAQLRVKF
ncbi:MAG: helix-hairpin-helix domain-containing protein, partial [Bacteroidetes bacterium]|nr:helix-hairpin-helix domain-containing protein [Bacteroidota bacterium]